jgi:signal peptidase
VSVEEKDGQTVFQTKGDANESVDMEKTNRKDIIGKVFLSVPFLGYPVAYAKTTPGLIILIVIPAVIIIYDELQKIMAEINKKLAYRKLAKIREEKMADPPPSEKGQPRRV